MVKFVMATYLPSVGNGIANKAKQTIKQSFIGKEDEVIVLDLENVSEETLAKYIDMGAIDSFCITSDTIMSSKTKNILARVLSANSTQNKNIKFINVLDGKNPVSVSDAKGTGQVLLDGNCNAMISHFDINSDEQLFMQNLNGIKNSATREKAMLQEKERDIMNFASRIVSTIEQEKDGYTGRHIRSVCAIGEAIARKFGIGEEEIDVLKIGALLHDIGKQDVSDSVLKKPSRLTDNEFQEMKSHVLMGEVELNQYDLGPFERAKKIAAEHHEKYDGTGYPRGLKADAIDILSRIVSLADAAQAMFGRSYQSGRTKDELIFEIKRCSGTQFDPQMSDILCDILDREPETIHVSYDNEGKISYYVPTPEELLSSAEQKRKEERKKYFAGNEDIIV